MSTAACQIDPQLWDAAYERVELRLRSYGVTNRVVLHQLTQEIVAAAADRHDDTPERDPVELAAEETDRRLRTWIDDLVESTDETQDQRFARGRAAVFYTRLLERDPAELLAGDATPTELRRELRATYLQAGPDFEFSSMVPNPIDLGIVSNIADETWRTFAKWSVLRGLTICTLCMGLFGTAFYLVRF